MPDVVDRATRSRMMSGIRGRNTKPELIVRRYLHARGLRYRLHVRTLPGTPDVVLPGRRAVVFVHGCFWHQHAGCRFAYQPKSRPDFWERKLSSNVARDARDRELLEREGWKVLVVWECATDVAALAELVDALNRQPVRRRPRHPDQVTANMETPT